MHILGRVRSDGLHMPSQRTGCYTDGKPAGIPSLIVHFKLMSPRADETPECTKARLSRRSLACCVLFFTQVVHVTVSYSRAQQAGQQQQQQQGARI